MTDHMAGAAAPPPGDYDADVVILAWERPAETVAAIRSALEQRGVSRHVFVVDQGSCPATLAHLTAAVAGRDDATLVTLGRNLGVPAGRNFGAALGHGQVIFGLDNDAEFASQDTLARAVAALEADAGLAAIGCRIVLHASGADDLSSWGYPRSLLARAGACFDAATFVGAGHAIRRSAWQQVGGYDPALFFCWEEYDFCLRSISRGWRVRYCGDVVVRHKVSGERRVVWSGRRWFFFVRNRLYIERKCGAAWIGLAPRYLGYLVKGLRNGALSPSLRALPAAIRLARTASPCALPGAARAYLHKADATHRGTAWHRLRGELLAAWPRGAEPH